MSTEWLYAVTQNIESSWVGYENITLFLTVFTLFFYAVWPGVAAVEVICLGVSVVSVHHYSWYQSLRRMVMYTSGIYSGLPTATQSLLPITNLCPLPWLCFPYYSVLGEIYPCSLIRCVASKKTGNFEENFFSGPSSMRNEPIRGPQLPSSTSPPGPLDAELGFKLAAD